MCPLKEDHLNPSPKEGYDSEGYLWDIDPTGYEAYDSDGNYVCLLEVDDDKDQDKGIINTVEGNEAKGEASSYIARNEGANAYSKPYFKLLEKAKDLAPCEMLAREVLISKGFLYNDSLSLKLNNLFYYYGDEREQYGILLLMEYLELKYKKRKFPDSTRDQSDEPDGSWVTFIEEDEPMLETPIEG